MYKIDNAVIMAAGTASRFAPLSYERPKALVEVKGEVLIERQIKQLKEVGIKDVYIVTGYKAEQFLYLKNKYGVDLIHNDEFEYRNNNSSIWAARDVINNTYICSADNYFSINPFEREVDESYYAVLFSEGDTKEWCVKEDESGYISSINIGGSKSWYMLGHTFWSEEFSRKFIRILSNEYELPETSDKLWEKIYMNHLDELKMKLRKYDNDTIFEFDTIDELREFDSSYKFDSRSEILKYISKVINEDESEIKDIQAFTNGKNEAAGFYFSVKDKKYVYDYSNKQIELK